MLLLVNRCMFMFFKISHNLTRLYVAIKNVLKKTECKEGVVTVLSKHSTVSITINEMEGRLVDDTRQFLLKLAPPSYPYLHNDLDFRLLSVLTKFIIFHSFCLKIWTT